MENSSESLEARTLRRTRKSSGIELESATKKTRSTKSIKMPEIEETADASSDPKTPSKSIKQLEYRTPSKSEAMTLTQTPRRSVRKSIKPVQEYENIVAQKGLKRAAISTLDDNDQANEGKWIPAVIGRVSTKRSKKPGRGKDKNLKRQRRFTDDSEDNNEGDGEMKKNDLESDGVEVLPNDEKNTIIEEQLPNAVDAVSEKENNVNSEPNVESRDELLPEENVENDHGHQSQEESLNKKVIEVEQVALGNESIVEKESIDSEHNLKHDSCNGLNENKLVEEININKSAKNQNDDVAEKENINSDHDPTHDGYNVLNEIKSVAEKQTGIEDGAKNQDGVSETKLDMDIRQDVHYQEKTLSANTSEGGDVCVKSPSMKETASGNVRERVDKKQINNVEEKEIERREKSVESTVEEPNHQKVDPQEVEEVGSSDTSTEEGDVELAGMPITADDSMDSPKKETHPTLADESLNLKSPIAFGDENADDSDCIMLSLDESSNTVKSETVSEEPTKDNKLLNDSTNSMDMPSLLVCSDDEEVQARKAEEVKVDETAKIPEPDESSRLNSTFDADQSVENPTAMVTQHTPVLRPSINHVPTPFKSKTPIIPDIIIEPEEDLQVEEPPTVVQESRETRIKSARKRSFSVCGDRPKRNVTFYSPANTTVSIYDGDLMSSCRKPDASTEKKHRKRSLSVTETDKEMFAYIKQKKIADTPESNKKQQHLSTSRTKMPNFSAIHQQQFKKMESISDHVARKAERAKILTNSALKAKPASVQKGLPVKNSVLRDCNKDSKTNLAVPKARQRIELSGIEHKQKPEQTGWLNVDMKIRTKSRNDLSALDDLPSIDKLYKFNTSSVIFSASSKPKLPKPRMDVTVSSTSKTLPLSSKTAKTAETAVDQTNKTDSRPKFNLSTAPESQSFRSAETLTDRRNRLMNMYKSRNHPRAGEKNREILKGVRTNRRFELQMMCRNRPN